MKVVASLSSFAFATAWIFQQEDLEVSQHPVAHWCSVWVKLNTVMSIKDIRVNVYNG
jgi:hypothetical protein